MDHRCVRYEIAYLCHSGDNGEDGQDDCGHQLDEDEGLDEDLLLWEDHLHIRHGHIIEGLDHNVALRHALKCTNNAWSTFSERNIRLWSCPNQRTGKFDG